MSTLNSAIVVSKNDEVLVGFAFNEDISGVEAFCFAEAFVQNFDLSLDASSIVSECDKLLGRGVFDNCSYLLMPNELDNFDGFVVGAINLDTKMFEFDQFYLEEDMDEVESMLDEDELLLVFPHRITALNSEVLIQVADWYNRVINNSCITYFAVLSEDVCVKHSDLFKTEDSIPNAYFMDFESVMNLNKEYEYDESKIFVGSISN